MDEREEEKQFLNQLQKYWEQRGVPMKIPQIGGRELEVYKLYKAVTKRGGLKVVSSNKLWKEIVDQFQFPATCTSASFTLRNHYQKLLLSYEQKYFFGKEDGFLYDDDLGSNRKKPRLNTYEDDNNQGVSYVEAEDRQHQQEYSGQQLSTLLNQQYAKTDKTDSIYFIKKSKITAQASEVKRIMLAFESKIDDELTYAINSLLLYSCNYQQSFLLDQYPQLLEGISLYIEDTIQVVSYLNLQFNFKQTIQTIQSQQLENCQGYQQRKNIQVQQDLLRDVNVLDNYNNPLIQFDLNIKPSELNAKRRYIDLVQGTYEKKSECKHIEKLRTLMVAIRNLCMIRGNEASFMKNEKMMSLIYQFLISGADAEIQKLALEMFSILSKHIHLRQTSFMDAFLSKIFDLLNGDSYEEIGLVVEIMRNLIAIQDNETVIEQCLPDYIDPFARLLAYQSQDIRESILEFFCYLSDLKMATRLQIAKHPKILSRITAILSIGISRSTNKSNNDKLNEKHVKLAAITLNNISQAPASKLNLQQFEKEIFIVAASDETVAPLLSAILYELSIE